MALAAHPTNIYAKSSVTTPTGTDEIIGLNSVQFSPDIDLLDVTDFKDTTGAKIKLAALTDGTISLDGDAVLSDAPQTLLRSSMLTGASVWITIYFNPSGSAGQKGFQVECKVDKYDVKASVAGKAEFSCSLQFTGAVALV
jgi:predicted secreted protein